MQKSKKQQKGIFLFALIVLFFCIVLFLITIDFFAKPQLLKSNPQQKIRESKFIPEYRRTAERVLLTISSQEPDSNLQALLERTYGRILEKFPSYTEFEIVVSENNLHAIERFIEKKNLSQRVAYKKVDNVPIEPWAQDYFEPAISDKEGVIFFFPKNEPLITPQRAQIRNVERNNLNSKITGEGNAIETSIFFEGGNITIAEDPNSKETLALVDYTNIADSLNEKNGPAEIASMLSENLDGIKIAIIGNMQRKSNFIHLDQSALPLPDNFVFLNKITGFPKSSAARQHETYKSQLEQLGFQVIEIATPQIAVQNSQSSLNAVIFFDKQEGREKVIYPVFEDEIVDNPKELSKENLQGKALQMYEELEKLNIKPIPLLDQDLYQNNAGYHCLVNILK